MENIKKCELCLEQIIKSEDFDNSNCDVTQICNNLCITVSKNARICPTCVGISKLTYNFRTSCLNNNDRLKTLIQYDGNNKLILEEVIVKEIKSEVKYEEKKVCRFCLNFFDLYSFVEVNVDQDVVLRDMLGKCLPEIDMNIVENPLICYICIELLEKLFNFIYQCENTEVLRNLDTKSGILVNENTLNVRVDNNEDSVDENLVKIEENHEDTEDPEIIKYKDFDSDKHAKASINNHNSTLKKDETLAESSTKVEEKKFSCHLCPYGSNHRNRIKLHYKAHEQAAEVNVFKCDKCPYVTKSKGCLNRHYTGHNAASTVESNPLVSGPFKCKECSYETDWRTSLLSHQRMHFELKDGVYNCTECSFETEYKRSLIRHKRKHKKEGGYCTKCSFTTSNKCELAKHKSLHKERKKDGLGTGNVKYPCRFCSHQATRKSDLKLHYQTHQNPTETEMFKCSKCPYVTKWNSNFVIHYKRWHQDVSKLPRYKCDECSYETIWTSGLVRHKARHKDPSKFNMYKCTECPYETKGKRSLQKHLRAHARTRENSEKSQQSFGNSLEDKVVIAEPASKKFACDKCSYQTSQKCMLKRHSVMHIDPSQVDIFKCDYCTFSTRWKNNLITHNLRHKNPKELPKFKCNDCPYETTKRVNLVNHVKVHKELLEVVMYKCKVCPFQTKYKRQIQIHESKHIVKDVYICDECNYQTKFESSFMVHLRYHKEWKQPVRSDQNLKNIRQYKCNECSYVGTQKSNLVHHQILHKDPSEREKYSCTECSFQALYKITLKRHYKKNHGDLESPFGELKTFYCNECDYETTHSRGISRHLQTHEQEKKTEEKDEIQEQDNAQDTSL